jgi:cell division transport system ATP-binding protein
MKLLYADLQPKRGEIWVEKYNLAEIAKKDKPFLRRRIGVVFQDFQLFGDRTIADNLDFVLRATGWRDASQRKARITDVLMLVGLSSKMNAMPHQLSGGEQQRTAIARALLNDPALLIADEPTGNLDPEVTDHIMELLNRVNRTGTAVLMATHEHDLIRRFPARVLECAEGRVLDHGTPQLQGHVIPNP